MTGDMERYRLGGMPRQARRDDRRGPVVRGRKREKRGTFMQNMPRYFEMSMRFLATLIRY